MVLGLLGCSNGEQGATKEENAMVSGFEVKCSSVTSDGRLLTKCAETSAGGENISPEISWEAVDGAASYAVYIFDVSASGWVHLKLIDCTKTSLSEGELTRDNYVGPYPPSGDHCYRITVYALKATPDETKGTLNCSTNIEKVETCLDTAGGATGNIISQGFTDVYYANGDNNV